MEDLDGTNNAGAVNVIYGTARGLRSRGNQLWHQGRLKGDLGAGDEFGRSLAARDFDGDGTSTWSSAPTSRTWRATTTLGP